MHLWHSIHRAGRYNGRWVFKYSSCLWWTGLGCTTTCSDCLPQLKNQLGLSTSTRSRSVAQHYRKACRGGISPVTTTRAASTNSEHRKHYISQQGVLASESRLRSAGLFTFNEEDGSYLSLHELVGSFSRSAFCVWATSGFVVTIRIVCINGEGAREEYSTQVV